MKKILLLAVSILWLAIPALAQDISGDWRGILKAGAVQLRLALHISKDADGNMKGTLDSLDQNSFGIPVSSIRIENGNVTIALDTILSRFEGTLSADAKKIGGTWKQGGRDLPVTFGLEPPPSGNEAAPVDPADVAGTWIGTLQPGAIKLRVVLYISNTPDGLTATMDSPDQNAKGIPVTSAKLEGSSLTLELKPLGALFTGTVRRDPTAIEGTFTQAGASFSLVLKPVEDEAILERRRPQNPTKPYPYTEEEVLYDNASAGIKLGGSLTIPSGNGPFPVAVLISGSGAQDRDESILGHKPFLVLTDHLTRAGIAVLRSDDRGIGKSGGNPQIATSADFATDVEAAVSFLKTRPEVDTSRIGLIGHSEGGLIAPLVASRNGDIAFIVLMAGPGVRGDKVLEEQARLIMQANGLNGAALEEAVGIQRESLALIMNEKNPTRLQEGLKEKLAGQMPEQILKNQLSAINTPWFRYFLEYDPTVALKQTRCPVLAVNGEKDLQVPPKQNLPAIRAALEEGGNRKFEIVEFPGLNHLFQTAPTGNPNEYGEIEETIAPKVLEKISSWILEQ